MNVNIKDNGSAYMITVNGLTVAYKTSQGAAWRHIKWMYEVESQEFTVGEKKVPVTKWIECMTTLGFID